MRSRTKLYILLVSVSLFSLISGLAISYYQIRSLFLSEFHSKAVSIAATAAAMLDPEPLKSINTPQDANLPSYDSFRNQLRAVRDHNQRENVYVVYIYTLKPSPTNSYEMVINVSAANTSEETEPIGSPYKTSFSNELHEHLYVPYSPKEFATDRWGTWLKAYAPMFDSQGKYVATLTLDISSEYIEYKLFHFFLIGFYSLLAALFLGLISAMFLSKKITSSFGIINNALKEITKGNFDAKPVLTTSDEFGELAKAIGIMTDELKQRETLKKSFARYVSSHVLEKTLEIKGPITLEGERKKISVIFCDIRDFGHITENNPPEEVVQILNAFFAKVIDIIFVNKGTLDKYLWDGVMVEFGAPMEDLEHEKHALTAALEMKKAIQELSVVLVSHGKPPIEVGIGVHSGFAVVGNIGSEKRMEYTAIGDTVNVASRLQALTKAKGVSIICSETTYFSAKNDFSFQELGDTFLPGRVEATKIYTLEAKSEVPN